MKNELLGKFEIGDKVAVHGEFKPSYDESNKKVPIEIPFKNPKFGIVCGASHKYLGTYRYGDTDPMFGDEQPHLSVEKVITVWKVALGLLNTPINCLTEQLQKTVINFEIPIRYYANKET
jgi:hypothetical protein